LGDDAFALFQSFENFDSLIADSPGPHGALLILARGFLDIDDGTPAVTQHC
jgi:hypothetical protein